MPLWTPIDAIPRPYVNASGAILVGYWLIAFNEGTTTRATLATKTDGTGEAAKFQTNSSGYFVNNGGTVVQLHIDRRVKLALVPTEAEADASDVSQALWVVDNISTVGNAGVDATLLNGQLPTFYTNASNLTSGTIPSARIAQGPASGLNADLLDGQHLAYALDRANHTGANVATDTALLQSQNGAYYLSRANHTGVEAVAALPIKHGQVNSGGTLVGGVATGVTPSYISTGRYLLTHNFNTTNYTVMISGNSDSNGKRIFDFYDKNINDVKIVVTDETGVLADTAYCFLLMLWA